MSLTSLYIYTWKTRVMSSLSPMYTFKLWLLSDVDIRILSLPTSVYKCFAASLVLSKGKTWTRSFTSSLHSQGSISFPSSHWENLPSQSFCFLPESFWSQMDLFPWGERILKCCRPMRHYWNFAIWWSRKAVFEESQIILRTLSFSLKENIKFYVIFISWYNL